MHQYSNDFFNKLESIFNAIKKENPEQIIFSNKILEIVNKRIKELHHWLIDYKFESTEHEILFFKEQKPKLISKLIFYNAIIEIESNAPSGNKLKERYYRKELNKIFRYSKTNTIFYQYYRSRASHNDLKYFTRNRDNNLRYYESHIVNYDVRLSTSHDYYVAQIIANDLLTNYLEERIEIVTKNCNLYNYSQLPSLNWTGNKIDLTELIYALHTKKVINSGDTDIKELAIFFGTIFNIQLEDNIYRWYSDIKNRKIVQTKFIDALSETLNQKLNQED